MSSGAIRGFLRKNALERPMFVYADSPFVPGYPYLKLDRLVLNAKKSFEIRNQHYGSFDLCDGTNYFDEDMVFPELFGEYDRENAGRRVADFRDLEFNAKLSRELFDVAETDYERQGLCLAMLGRWQALVFDSRNGETALTRNWSGVAFENLQAMCPEMQAGLLDYIQAGSKLNRLAYARLFSEVPVSELQEARDAMINSVKPQIYKFAELYGSDFENQDYAVRELGREFGRNLSFDANRRLGLTPDDARKLAFKDFGVGCPGNYDAVTLDDTMPGMAFYNMSKLGPGRNKPGDYMKEQWNMDKVVATSDDLKMTPELSKEVDAYLSRTATALPRFEAKSHHPGYVFPEMSGLVTKYGTYEVQFTDATTYDYYRPKQYDNPLDVRDMLKNHTVRDGAVEFEALRQDAAAAKDLISKLHTNGSKEAGELSDKICWDVLYRWQAQTMSMPGRTNAGMMFENLQIKMPDMQLGLMDYIEAGAAARQLQCQDICDKLDGKPVISDDVLNASYQKFADVAAGQAYSYLHKYQYKFPMCNEYQKQAAVDFDVALAGSACERMDTSRVNPGQIQVKIPDAAALASPDRRLKMMDFGLPLVNTEATPVQDVTLDDSKPGVRDWAKNMIGEYRFTPFGPDARDETLSAEAEGLTECSPNNPTPGAASGSSRRRTSDLDAAYGDIASREASQERQDQDGLGE